MPIYTPARQSVKDLAAQILCATEMHKPLLDARVKIDFVEARACEDPETHKKLDVPITIRGRKAFGLTRVIGPKDRVMGRGDVEVTIDADYWDDLTELQQMALLDHELTHISIKLDKRGIVRDDAGRPKINLRLHDIEVGWFNVVALRHGAASQERIQAKSIVDVCGQYYFPQFVAEV